MRDEREAKLRPHDFRLAPDPKQREATLKKIADANGGKLAPGTLVPGSVFCLLPAADATAAFNGARHGRFAWAGKPYVEMLVARHGLAVVPGVVALAKVNLDLAVLALARVVAPAVAIVMAEALGRPRTFGAFRVARAAAQAWLLAYPEAAAVGLVPVAAGAPGEARTRAETGLRFLAPRGHRGAILSVADRHGREARGREASDSSRDENEVRAAIERVLASDPLLVPPRKLPSVPRFADPAALTAPLLAGADGARRSLPKEAVATVTTMLAFTDFDEPYPGLLEIASACEPRSLAAYAWDLFQGWVAEGMPSKSSWALQALGIFGDDETARRLAPLVRTWPGDGGHARAVVGLDVLARIGSDVALMHLHGIAQRVRFHGLREKAQGKIEEVADARGLTTDELADRLVPDLGIGERFLDFGPRRFDVVLADDLSLSLREPDGSARADLPRPAAGDDPERAAEAVEAFKALKKDLKVAVTEQRTRLELAMCSGRRWGEAAFRTLLVEHPLLGRLVRGLVWGTYDAGVLLGESFRVAEDGTFASVADASFTLRADARIGIAHRIELGEEATRAWADLLADYRLIQPFEQLGRPVFQPTAAEGASRTLSRADGVRVAPSKILGLDRRGWRRGEAQDGGYALWYEKRLGPDLVASLALDPGLDPVVREASEQTLGDVTLSSEGGMAGTVTFGVLAPIAFSELVNDLESLRP